MERNDDLLVLVNQIWQPSSGKERNTMTGKNTSVIRAVIKANTNPIPTKSNQVSNNSVFPSSVSAACKNSTLSMCLFNDDTATRPPGIIATHTAKIHHIHASATEGKWNAHAMEYINPQPESSAATKASDYYGVTLNSAHI